MKKTGSKSLRVFGSVVVGLLLILAVYLAGYAYWTWPVYPAFEKELESLTELRGLLGKNDATKDMFIVDLTEFGAASQKNYVYMDGRTRCANPYSGYVRSENAGENGSYSLWMSGEIQTSKELPGGMSYRSVPSELEISDVEVPEGNNKTPLHVMMLELHYGAYNYSIGGSFETTELSKEEIAERETDLQALLYSIADRIIDAAQAQ